MNWDKVSKENKYKRGGTQRVGGQNRTLKSLPDIRTAKKPGHCKVCGEGIERGQKIVQGAGRPAVHKGCFRY